jgi:dTDP-glucose 4,6-dehydratase
MNVRDWIYVQDHCQAIDDVMRRGRTGEVYNIGSDHDVPNLEIVKQILALVDRPESLIQFVEDRPGHDRRYAMDSSKIRNEIGWAPTLSFEDALKATVQWYLDNNDWLEHVRSGTYQGYYEMLYGERGPAA